MSIPKEPRQLMINLMYLVLTAMLALNVSAEIFNAFKIVNDGLEQSNKVLDDANAPIPAEIARLAKAENRFQAYADRATPVRELSKETTDYITEIYDLMVDDAGDKSGAHDDGDYKMDGDKKKMMGIKDKDVTTRNLIDNGKGEELKAKMLEVKSKFMEFVDEEDRASFAANIAIDINEEDWQAAKKSSWSEYNFSHMPLGAVQPMFTKWINDIKGTEAATLNYLMGKVGGETLVFDKFQVVSAPARSYVIKGEKFETDVFLTASASSGSNTKVDITVNGQRMDVKDGVAKFTQTASKTGVQNYSATVKVTNPVTGEVETVKGDFKYEVGLRSVAVSLDKMNVFYIGVDNPISVSAAGVNTKDLKVNASGGGLKLKPNGNGKYVATVSAPGAANITVSGGGLEPTKFDYKVKRIPDPVVMLGKLKGGNVKSGVFKAMPGLIPWLENFDFEAKCQIQSFDMTRVAKRADPVVGKNSGGKFSGKADNMKKAAKAGDLYLFENIKGRCPGDSAGRDLGSLSFKIK